MIKLLTRLKARFDRKPKGQQSDRLPPAQPADQQESMSRVQENLAWLPVYKEPEPLRLQPPACPPLRQQDEPLRAPAQAGGVARRLKFTASRRCAWRWQRQLYFFHMRSCAPNDFNSVCRLQGPQ